jgi:hypothetical protein
MANKSLNDYSGLSGLFRDGTLGVLISTGILGTLVPNSIESIGKTQNLSSFKTLNLFSVIYFLLPIIIFTVYWHARGSQLLIKEKFSRQETDKFDYPTEYAWLKIILTFLKLLPIGLFIYDESFFSDWNTKVMMCVLGIWYVSIAISQLALSTHINAMWLNEFDFNRKDSFTYHSFCVNALIYFLDIIIGLTLIVFSKPWILYSNYFYLFAGTVIVLFAMASWFYSIFQFASARLNIEDYVVAVLLVSSGLLFPSINTSLHSYLIALTLLLFVGVTIWWLYSDKHSNNKESIFKKVVIPALFIFISAGLLHITFFTGFGRLNTSYLKHRYLASKQIPENEIFPFSCKDEKLYSDLDKENLVMPIYINSNLLKTNLKYSNLLLDSTNLRHVYYKEYYVKEKDAGKTQFKIEDVITKTFTIDKFYEEVFSEVEKIPLKDFKHRLQEINKRDLEVYLHPVDYTAYRLKRMAGQKAAADSMVKLTEHIYHLSLLEKNSQKSADGLIELTNLQGKKMAARLDTLYKQSARLRYDESGIKLPLDSAQLVKVVKFHKLYFELMEIEYIKAYEGAQKVFRSYLVDSQRIGIWTFLTAVLALGLAAYFNNKANRLLTLTSKEEQRGKEEWPLDTPRNSLLILTIAITILVVPLLKPIESENIDPEKPYWMVSLQNWHTPSFVKALTDKDQETYRYSSNRPIINNQINFTELQEGLKAISDRLEKSNDNIKKIEESVTKLREQIKKDANQIDHP